MESSTRIGILDIGFYIPEEYILFKDTFKKFDYSKEIEDKIGFVKKPIEKKLSRIEMCVKSFENLSSKINIDKSKKHYIIYCSSGVNDKYFWSSSSKISQKIGLKNSFCFDIGNGCNSGNLGLHLAKSILEQEINSNVILFICDKLSEFIDYNDINHIPIFNFSDGSSAIYITKETNKNIILSSSFKTDSKYCDNLYLDTKNYKYKLNDTDKKDSLELSMQYQTNYPEVIRSALKIANINISEIKKIFINQGDPKLIPKYEDNLNLKEGVIFRTHSNYGHIGGIDPFYGYDMYLREGNICTGDYIVLASSSFGFSWGASVVRV